MTIPINWVLAAILALGLGFRLSRMARRAAGFPEDFLKLAEAFTPKWTVVLVFIVGGIEVGVYFLVLRAILALV